MQELHRVWNEGLDYAAFSGPAVENCEKAFADFCETGHAMGVASDTDSLVLALEALNIGKGDEVIVPANSFVATAEAVVHAGATPLFVDVDPATSSIDLNKVESEITQLTNRLQRFLFKYIAGLVSDLMQQVYVQVPSRERC